MRSRIDFQLRPKERQALKLAEIREALVAAGYDTTAKQAAVLGVGRSTAWWLLNHDKKTVLRLASSNVFFHRRIFRQQCGAKSKSTFRKGSAACMGIACQRHGRFVEALRSAPWLEPDKPIYNPQEELMDLEEEIGKLVGPRLMTQRAHDIERIMSSVARLTSSSIEGLENLTSELHELQKFLKTEVARVQSEVDNAMAGSKS